MESPEQNVFLDNPKAIINDIRHFHWKDKYNEKNSKISLMFQITDTFVRLPWLKAVISLTYIVYMSYIWVLF